MANQQETRAPAQRQSAPPPSERRRTYAGGAQASPFSLMRRMFDDMDRMFEDFGFGGLMPRIGVGRGSEFVWNPQVDVLERDGKLVVRADLPGVKKEDVTVEIRDGVLYIEGERRQESEERREGFYRSERMYGAFERAIPLPDGINAEQAQARFENGVLEILLPIPQEEAARRRVEIRDASDRGAGGQSSQTGTGQGGSSGRATGTEGASPTPQAAKAAS